MSTGASVPAPIEVQPKSPSAFMRVLQTIYAPTQAFTGMNPKTAWILPWILTSVISMAFMFTVDKKIGFDKVIENQLRQSPKQMEQLDRLPEAQKDSQIHLRAVSTKIVGEYLPLLTVFLIYGIFALLYWGTLTFACGAKMNFWTALSVTMLGGIPGVIKVILSIIVLFVGVDPDGFNINSPVATNVGSFFDPLAHPFLAAFGTVFLDVFMLWMLIVMAIGFSSVTKVKRSTALAVTLGWCAFFALIMGGVALAFS